MEVKNLDLDDKQLQLLKNILKEKVDSKTVWAYGSRIDGTSDKKSDLDLVVFDITTKDLLKKEVLEERTCIKWQKKIFNKKSLLKFIKNHIGF